MFLQSYKITKLMDQENYFGIFVKGSKLNYMYKLNGLRQADLYYYFFYKLI